MYARSTAAAMFALLMAVSLSGCDDQPPEISSEAVDEASDVVGGTAHDALPLAPADVELMAGLALVDADVVGEVASSLSERDVWARSMAAVRSIYDDAPPGVEHALVDVACEAAEKELHTDLQLHYAIYQRVNGFDTEEINGLTEAAWGLYRTVYEAGHSDRAEDRAAAALTCHTLGVALA